MKNMISIISSKSAQSYNKIPTHQYILNLPYKKNTLYPLPNSYLDLLIESYNLKSDLTDSELNFYYTIVCLVCGKKFLSIIYTDKVEGKLGN
jgi:hypothetical protein